jgi:hypothetical protein
MTKKFKDMDMYMSGKEKYSVAFDVIRHGKVREYFRIASGGMGFLDKGMGNLKIIGVDCYEPKTS